MDPLNLLKLAAQRLPSLKYSFGVLGAIAVLVISKEVDIDYAVLFIGVPGVIFLMTMFLIFDRLVDKPKRHFSAPTSFLVWGVLVIFFVGIALLLSSVFFSLPVDLKHWISTTQSVGDDVAVMRSMNIRSSDVTRADFRPYMYGDAHGNISFSFRPRSDLLGFLSYAKAEISVNDGAYKSIPSAASRIDAKDEALIGIEGARSLFLKISLSNGEIIGPFEYDIGPTLTGGFIGSRLFVSQSLANQWTSMGLGKIESINDESIIPEIVIGDANQWKLTAKLSAGGNSSPIPDIFYPSLIVKYSFDGSTFYEPHHFQYIPIQKLSERKHIWTGLFDRTKRSSDTYAFKKRHKFDFIQKIRKAYIQNSEPDDEVFCRSLFGSSWGKGVSYVSDSKYLSIVEKVFYGRGGSERWRSREIGSPILPLDRKNGGSFHLPPLPTLGFDAFRYRFEYYDGTSSNVKTCKSHEKISRKLYVEVPVWFKKKNGKGKLWLEGVIRQKINSGLDWHLHYIKPSSSKRTRLTLDNTVYDQTNSGTLILGKLAEIQDIGLTFFEEDMSQLSYELVGRADRLVSSSLRQTISSSAFLDCVNRSSSSASIEKRNVNLEISCHLKSSYSLIAENSAEHKASINVPLRHAATFLNSIQWSCDDNTAKSSTIIPSYAQVVSSPRRQSATSFKVAGPCDVVKSRLTHKYSSSVIDLLSHVASIRLVP